VGSALRRLRTLVAAFALLCADGVAAQVPFDSVPLADVLEVMLVDRDLVAIDANSGGQRRERLLLGENVIWIDSRGAVGVVLTDQRVLAVGVGSSSWQESRYLRTESAPRDALLGDRVALVTTASRAIGFGTSSGNLIETQLGVHEKIVARRVGANVGVVVTDRRALGLSPMVGGFFAVDLLLKEDIEAIDARANLVTLTTDRRLLIFRSPTGSWEERRRELNP
jgi:hypothetical protein